MSRSKKRRSRGKGLAPSKPASPPVPATVTQVQIEHERSFSGPLPPPDFLRQYDAVVPGLADRIVRMAEKQETHRHGLEKQVVAAEIKRAYLGMASGLLVALFGLTIGGILLYHEKVVVGSIFAGGTLVSIVGVFVYGVGQRRKEREAKARIMTGG